MHVVYEYASGQNYFSNRLVLPQRTGPLKYLLSKKGPKSNVGFQEQTNPEVAISYNLQCFGDVL